MTVWEASKLLKLAAPLRQGQGIRFFFPRRRVRPWSDIAEQFDAAINWYFIQTFILWMNMDNWYNLPALNHPTKRSDKAFPSEAACR